MVATVRRAWRSITDVYVSLRSSCTVLGLCYTISEGLQRLKPVAEEEQ